MKLLKTSLIWGIGLWLIGYVLGIILFMLVPSSAVGWIIMPIGTLITLFVLYKKIQLESLKDYVILGAIWALIAIVLDYFLLVKLFKPADGYYKLDVYLYYTLTFLLPVLIGRWKLKQRTHTNVQEWRQ